MAISPKHLPAGYLQDFRAPPPSPIGPGADRRSLFINEEELSEFLEHSLQVPDLILPDRIFPKEISTQNPPKIDFNTLISTENSEIDSISKILDSFSAIGCFQLLNHGISSELIESVLLGATGVFAMSPEKKAIVSRSLGNRYGFKDLLEDKDEMEMMSEEFVWCRNEEGLKSVMEGIWSDGYSNFSQKLETLSTEIEKVASKVFMILSNNTKTKPTKDAKLVRRLDDDGLVCCLYKHCRNTPASRCDGSLRSDVIRILMKGSDYSHALCIHLCDGSSEFHLYSKKGWVSFCPSRGAIVVTIGDQIQAWSGGQYKHVIGRPIFKEEAENNISMDFLYSPPNFISKSLQGTEMKIFSLKQQFILAMFLTLMYHFIF